MPFPVRCHRNARRTALLSNRDGPEIFGCPQIPILLSWHFFSLFIGGLKTLLKPFGPFYKDEVDAILSPSHNLSVGKIDQFV